MQYAVIMHYALCKGLNENDSGKDDFKDRAVIIS